MKLSPYLKHIVLALISGYLIAPLPACADPEERQVTSTATPPAYATVRDGSIDTNVIPAYEAMWALFAAVTGLEQRHVGKGRDLLRDDIGLTEKSADALAHYMHTAFDDTRVRSLDVTKQTCSQRSKFIEPAALARRLSETDKQIDRERETHVANMAQALDPAAKKKVIEWVDANLRPTLRITSFDYAAYLKLEQVTPDMFLDRLCKPQTSTQDR